MLMYADFFCSFTMPPGYLLVPTLGYHPPAGIIDLLGYASQSKHRLLQRCSHLLAPERRLHFELLSQQCLLTTALARWVLLSVPPPNVPAMEARFSFALVAGGWSEMSRWEIHGQREFGMWQWGWAREASVSGESERGDTGGLGSCWQRRAGRGEWDFWGGGCWRVWKWVRRSPSLFPDPLFLPHCLTPGQALSAGTLRGEAGGKDTARRRQNPRDFCSCCQGGWGKGWSQHRWEPPTPPSSPGRGLWDLGAGLSTSHPSLRPIPLSPRRGEVSPAASQARLLPPLPELWTSSVLSSISKYYIQNYITEFMSNLA